MFMLIISNAFSIGMLSSSNAILEVKEVSAEDVKALLSRNEFVSVVGHQTTADVLSLLLNVKIPTNRIQVQLKPNDKLIVFQLLSRLPEGVVLTADEVLSLPHKFYTVEVLPYNETIEALYHW